MRYGDWLLSCSRVDRLTFTLVLLVWMGCRPPAGVGPVAGGPEPTEPTTEGPEEPNRTGARAGAALIRVSAEDVPPLLGALRGDRTDLIEAVERSLAWFKKPSSRDYFPLAGVTHEHAWASVLAFRELIEGVLEREELERRILSEFDFFSSAGSDGRGGVLFTGYYSPLFEASRTRTDAYRYPLYGLPGDLVKDPVSGEVKGRRVGERVVPYPTRAEIEESQMLAGSELAWLRDPFEVYLIHLQGSAALSLADGSILYVGYAGNNGREYVSVARELVADGKIAEDELGLDEVRDYFSRHPEELEPYLRRNPRFIFFREADGSSWPVGSLGVRVTPLRSLATDKDEFPPGGVVLVVTFASDDSGRVKRIERFMLDQDSGGAIRTPGRADIYYGMGKEAERRAGAQYSDGRLYFLFLKPERLGVWKDRLPRAAGG